jgi:hypothetical protein
VGAAGGEHAGHLPGVRGPHDGASIAAVAARPVDLEGGADVVVDEDVALADGCREAFEQIVGHM